jgi:hypothetical protein
MTDRATIERDLIPMIQRFGDSRKRVLLSAAIYHDLRIAGDDAGELLDEISKRFGTSFREMHFPTYFPIETEVFGSHWANVFGFKDKKRPRVTVEHLIAVIERGHWFAS